MRNFRLLALGLGLSFLAGREAPGRPFPYNQPIRCRSEVTCATWWSPCQA